MIDPDLVRRWAAGWAATRGLPVPVARDGFLYIPVGKPGESGRWIVAAPKPELVRTLAERAAPEQAHLKLLCPAAPARAMLPAGWTLDEQRYFMVAPVRSAPEPALPPGYAARLERSGEVTRVVIEAGAEEAAYGGLVIAEGLAVFDRIRTHDAHQRRGLGRAVMRLLEQAALAAGAREAALVATAQGRELYRSLGWQQLEEYTTAFPPPL